jgi:hypothetical protein
MINLPIVSGSFLLLAYHFEADTVVESIAGYSISHLIFMIIFRFFFSSSPVIERGEAVKFDFTKS